MTRDIEATLRERVMVLDGAMGTMLQQKGLMPGMCPELFGIENPHVLEDIHRQYREAGADIIETNTFGGNRLKLAEYGLSDRLEEINTAAVVIARRAAAGKALVAGNIGPTGQLLKPMGKAEFDELYKVFREQAMVLERAGADLISIETMTDVGEMRAALIAVKSSTRLPVLAHLAFETGSRTMMGTDPETALIILDALQPLAIGANCSGGARELLPVIQAMSRYSRSYLSVEPNAGLPRLVGNQTVFPDTPEEMAEYALRLRSAGANIIGGCCGTTPQHIQAMAGVLQGLAPARRDIPRYWAFASRSRHVFIGQNYPLAIIGERINPTARKKLSQDIKEGKMQVVVDEAKKQAHLAPILDVNMGVPGIDEPQTMKQAVMAIQASLDMPIAIDSTNPEAVEEALKNFVGRPLINSTTGEDKNLDRILPLAKKYGAAVLGLCLDEKGIPAAANERVQIARKIYSRALEHGLRDEDIFIDCLVKTASAEQAQVMETLAAVRQVKQELGLATVLGVSNVSHGLPAREILNSTFLAMAWAAGLDLPILNPFDSRMMEVTRAAAVLMNRDANSADFIAIFKDYQAAGNAAQAGVRHPVCRQCNIPDLLIGLDIQAPPKSDAGESKPVAGLVGSGVLGLIKEAVLNGETDAIIPLIDRAMQQESITALELVNQALVPGIEQAGELYEQKQYFLPQLMMAAETMKKAFAYLKPHLSGEARQDAGAIVIATVEGDIHDIGKNIVIVMLENYGFRIIDLGKDVPAETILDTAQREDADIIGLSALMTTTMPRMQEVITGARQRGLRARIMVGGAVLNQEYADRIGADGYSADARAAVKTAQRLMSLFLK